MKSSIKKERVVLIKEVPATGEVGDTVLVTKGYARNYLIPSGLALPDRNQARHLIAGQQTMLERLRAEKRSAAEATKKQLEAEALEIKAQVGDEGKLFGAITTMTIHELLLQKDIHIARKHIHLSQKLIHEVGEYHCDLILYQDVVARLHFKVVPKAEAAKQQAKKQSVVSKR